MQAEQRALIRTQVNHSYEPFVKTDIADMFQRGVMDAMLADENIKTVQNLRTAVFQGLSKVVLFLERDAQLDDDQEADKHFHYVVVVLGYFVLVAKLQTAHFGVTLRALFAVVIVFELHQFELN